MEKCNTEKIAQCSGEVKAVEVPPVEVPAVEVPASSAKITSWSLVLVLGAAVLAKN